MSNSDELQGFRAEQLLGDDSYILKQIKDFNHDLRYSTAGDEVSLDAYYARMDDAITKLPRLTLDYSIPPGTEDEYSIRLSDAFGHILDDSDRVGSLVLEFQSRLKNAERDIKRLRTEFGAWYILAANIEISDRGIKFPPALVKQIAESEFSRLMEALDVQVDSLIAQVDHLSERVKGIKKHAADKFSLGKDQINLSYTSKMSNNAFAPNQSNDLATIPEEEESEGDVPAYVSKRASVGSRTEEEPEAMEPTPEPPAEPIMIRYAEKVPLQVTDRAPSITFEESDAVAELLNQPAAVPSVPRKRLLLTDDEELM